MPSEAREPAPEPLELVRAFVNTADLEAGRDRFDDPDGLVGWLRERGLIGDEPVEEGDRQRAVALREAVRAALLAHNGEQLDPGAARELDRAAARAPLVTRFAGGDAGLVPAGSGVDGALAAILGAIYTATVDGSWPRLKACRNDGCQWAFYDSSKNRSGAWCTMRLCGSRAKSRAYRARRA